MTRRERNKSNGVARMILLAVGLTIVTYIVRGAYNEFADHVSFQSNNESVWGDYRFWDIFRIRAFDTLFAVWLFAVGSSVGSFLNVVVYRMPRGESINKRGSHCPYCNQPIRMRDNIPVFGWINLGGRCHACRLPISIRYPIVEAVTGFAFVFLFWFETGTGGRFLPFFEPVKYSNGILGIFGQYAIRERELMGMNAYHLLVCTVLWAGLLIERDGHRVPAIRLFLVPYLIAIVCCTLIWSHLIPVDWFIHLNIDQSIGARPSIGRTNGLAGMFAGVVLGHAIAWLIERNNPHGKERNAFIVNVGIVFGFVGVTFGWQSIALMSSPFVILLYVCRAYAIQNDGNRRYDYCSVLCVLTIGHWLIWKLMYQAFEETFYGVTFVLSALIAVIIAVAFRFPPRPGPVKLAVAGKAVAGEESGRDKEAECSAATAQVDAQSDAATDQSGDRIERT